METNTDQHIHVNLNLNVRGLAPSATLAINEKSNKLISSGHTVYKLGLGQSPFPVPERVVNSLKENSHQKDYLPVQGLEPLREAVAGFHEKEDQIEFDPGDIMIGPGSKELLFLLQLVYYGELIIPVPGWVSYSPQAKIVGRQVHMIPTTSKNYWRLTPEQLDLICRTDPSRPRIVILNYPSNPTGQTYDEDHLKELAEVARKYKVVLISDEIYGRTHHEGKHISIARYYPEGTILSSGLSKWCGAGGWRLGTFSFPGNLRWLKEAMCIVASETYTATSAPIQYAAISAFNGGADIDEYLFHSRKVLKILGNKITDKLKDLHVDVLTPKGAFYLYPDFSYYSDKLKKAGIKTSVELCNRLLHDIRVAILPGYDFGNTPDALLTRIAYVDFDGRKALKSASTEYKDKELDIAFVKNNAPRLVVAFNKLESWLKAL